MTKMYVVSTKYLPLVTVKLFGPIYDSESKRLYPFKSKTVTMADLQNLVNSTKVDGLIACSTEADAQTVLGVLVEGHNTSPDMIEPGVRFFASPAILVVELDGEKLTSATPLTGKDLVGYVNKTELTVCCDYGPESDELLFSSRLERFTATAPITIQRVSGFLAKDVQEVIYLKADASGFAHVDLRAPRNPSEFFAGTAAGAGASMPPSAAADDVTATATPPRA